MMCTTSMMSRSMDIGYHDIGHVIHEIYTSSSLCVLILWYIIASPDSTLARTSQCIPTVCSTCAKSTSPLLLFSMDLLTMDLDPHTCRSIHGWRHLVPWNPRIPMVGLVSWMCTAHPSCGGHIPPLLVPMCNTTTFFSRGVPQGYPPDIWVPSYPSTTHPHVVCHYLIISFTSPLGI